MSGIVGLFDLQGLRDFDCALVREMNESQRHRGPDDGKLHLAPGLALGHRRLSVIDIAAGQQPLLNEDGSVALVFDGEIYNFQALASELAALGHVFRTGGNAEVIVRAWEAWGEACVGHFRGMFAFALWDRARQTLFLARDRLGVKPLYYAALGDGSVIFGSELKALMRHPGFGRKLDSRAVEEFFAFGYVPDPRTIFLAAWKLPPGHTLSIRRGGPLPVPREYWDLRFSLDNPIGFEEAAAEFSGRLREAVRLRLTAEAPLGALLTGDTDSSAVFAAMAGLSEKPVDTCSITFGDSGSREAALADTVARLYHGNHFNGTARSDDFDLVDTLSGLYDEPFADSAAMPFYRLCELARKRMTVALSGVGGDEILAGHRRYRMHLAGERLRAVLPAGVRQPIFGLLGGLYSAAGWAPRLFRGRAVFQAFAKNTVEAYFHSVSLLRDDMRRRLFSVSFRRDLAGYEAIEVFRRHIRRAQTSDPLALVQYLDIKTSLAGFVNTRVDRASMAHSLEVRAPLIDHMLVEWLAALPSAFKRRGREGRLLLKKAMEAQLPRNVLHQSGRPSAVPFNRWLRGPLKGRVREIILGDTLAATGIFDTGYLQHLVDTHLLGVRDHGTSLWALLTFEAFLRHTAPTVSST
ncbi:MAG: amidotransferase 1, exosortase A system-associated [Azoarcus sp.]|jgi:asparagine synthase (glutamine-hydrolysing)|nr:amidotransferase 1, exosortase A system-associated [Azoarcus sp.]